MCEDRESVYGHFGVEKGESEGTFSVEKNERI
jgi:hypothetical protein